MQTYLVDSNFFIQAHRALYPLDIATGFWNKIKMLADSGTIFSIDKVKNELFDKNDELENWCKINLPDNFFKDSSLKMQEYSQITEWAISKSDHYLPKALTEFLDADEADAFIVAYALSEKDNITIVTQEVSDLNRKNRIKIPEPCNEFGIKYINTIEMFRQIGETF
ncbi:MAG: DUF4411 family protein [Melioribacteraceae bacterium]|nr:DUF4411 family protein [Melioribacteraceae bacterium]MCF8430803.1 DUF4411 family protein [Melioribacteraceae bacterium]